MPTKFSFEKNGTIKVRVRMKRLIDGVPREVVNQRQFIQDLKINEADWNRYNAYKNENSQTQFLKDNPIFAKEIKKLDAIREKIDNAGYNLDSRTLRDIIHVVTHADAIEEANQLKAEREKSKQEKEEAEIRKKQMTLSKFIDEYIKDVKEGNRTTLAHGRTFVRGSRFSVANSLGHFKEFMEETGITYDFKDVDMDCYNRYMTWLIHKDINPENKETVDKDGNKVAPKVKKEEIHYSDNTIGGFIRKLKGVLRAADSRGYPVNPAYKSVEFKAQALDVDAIYLTREEIEKMEKVDLSKTENNKSYELARDLFMIGVWTAQRVSDYNNLKPENIKVVNNGDTPITYISIHQQKTGRQVEIPCNAKVRAILEKYPKGLPHLSDQKINMHIKDIGKLAGIDDVVEIKSSRGGMVTKEYHKKYELICTHTARRTGATLMYLDGVAVYDIMKVTGHTSVTSLEKYIRADKLEVAQKLVLQYDYFK